ncbi:hypothetical protein M3P19_03085 [Muricauda sp. 2012CJ35-5]|uniref:Sensor of ECF-type sigma factor n=1 Tax=Flagellimonas spongiicola TaxID=2942208 RepID=A0ABT0PNL1_9FLAO|nr:hypothetical protein [Allomuricauda spongiicola]MCL6272974.1 hypothetical protein [Allomuricauda spongiicola]
MKIMIKNLFIVLAFVLVSSSMTAQGPARERIRTLKIAFITERVNLTSSEAQNFWPIYNAYEAKLETIRRKERLELRSRIAFIEELSSNESATLLQQYNTIQKAKYEAEKEFLEEIRDVISPKKTLLLLKAEEDFKKRLLQQMRKRRNSG